MIHRTFLTIAASAAGAFGLTLAILTPTRLDANGPSTMPQKIEPPVLNAGGVQFFALYDGKTPELRNVILNGADASGKIALKAVNSMDRSATASVIVRLNSRTMNPLSRVAPSNREFFRKEETITLAPHETRMILVAPEVALPATSMVTMSLESGQLALPLMTVNVGPVFDPRRAATSRPSVVYGDGHIDFASANRGG